MVWSSVGVPSMQTAKFEDLLSRAELATRLGVRPTTIGRWTRSGRIPARRLSPKVVRYNLSAVLAALEGQPQAQGREGRP
jgi:excisionase family DNA binding protein